MNIEGIGRKNCRKMGPSEKEVCIKCDKGGKVLACADSGCPVAVHERCMGCPVRLDELGKFYCPYCLYRNAVAKFHRAKEHILPKKEALDTFIDKEMIGNGKEMPSLASRSRCDGEDERLLEKKSNVPQSNCDQQQEAGQQIQSGTVVANCDIPSAHTSCKATAGKVRVLETGNRVQVNDLREVGEHQLEKSVEDHNRDGHLSNSCVAEGEKLGNDLVEEEIEKNSVEFAGEQMTGVYQANATFMNMDSTMQNHLKGKRSVATGDSIRGESKPVSTQRKSGRHVNKIKDEPMSNSPRRLTRTSASLCKDSNGAGQLVQVKERYMQLPVVLPNVKRKRVLWSRQEEEMLEEGVQKFSTIVNKNIPWRKILEFGSHVFDQTRTPSDLKDKWKNICSKYGGRV